MRRALHYRLDPTCVIEGAVAKKERASSKVRFLLHDNRLVAALEYMPHPSMPAIKTPGVNSV